MDLFDLSGRVALVTGGNGGIGFGMAEGLATAGAAVIIAGRDQSKSQTAVAALRERGGTAEAVTVDVAEETSCRAMVAAAVEAFGRLDILVNNAGINIGKQPEEMTLVEWNTVLATNLTSAFISRPGRISKYEGPGERQNNQYWFDVFAFWWQVRVSLWCKQGRHRSAYKIARHCLGSP
jgi:shikimate 5-dehydrogenase